MNSGTGREKKSRFSCNKEITVFKALLLTIEILKKTTLYRFRRKSLNTLLYGPLRNLQCIITLTEVRTEFNMDTYLCFILYSRRTTTASRWELLALISAEKKNLAKIIFWRTRKRAVRLSGKYEGYISTT